MNKNAYAFALVIAGAVLFSGLSLILTSPPTFTLAAETVQSNSHQAASNMITVSMTTEGGGEGGQAQFHLGEAIKALQGGDTDGAMMHMEEADKTLEAGEAKMHLGEAIKALQGGDTDGAMTHLELAQ